MKTLDFVIIGAQKCATTALYAYLKEHPDIAMPALKEAPFYVSNDSSPQVWEAFCATHFSGQQSSHVWGKASPQYMTGTGIPERIAQHAPNVKLIALVRDPIKRAWSHYQMDVRRETESRDFEQIVNALLEPESLERARRAPAPLHTQGYESESDYYLVWGEYGRILQEYRRHFSCEQLLVLQVDDLRDSPENSLDTVLNFLGMEPGFRPANLGNVVHKGGSQRIISNAGKQRLLDLWPVKAIWNAVPQQSKHRLRYWFDQHNIKGDQQSMHLSSDTELRLRQHFAADLEMLKRAGNIQPGWESDYLKTGQSVTGTISEPDYSRA